MERKIEIIPNTPKVSPHRANDIALENSYGLNREDPLEISRKWIRLPLADKQWGPTRTHLKCLVRLLHGGCLTCWHVALLINMLDYTAMEAHFFSFCRFWVAGRTWAPHNITGPSLVWSLGTSREHQSENFVSPSL